MITHSISGIIRENQKRKGFEKKVNTSEQIAEIMENAKIFYSSIVNPGQTIKEGVSGSSENDSEIAADKMMGDFFIRELRKIPWIKEIVVEGRPPVFTNIQGKCIAFVDPLDASLNAKTEEKLPKEGYLNLPYTAVVTIAKIQEDNSEQIFFRDLIMAYIIDLRPNQNILASVNLLEMVPKLYMNGQIYTPRYTTSELAGDLNDTNIELSFEAYYLETTKKIVKMRQQMANPDRYWRSVGSAAEDMLRALLNVGIYVCASQKMHELGAIWVISQATNLEGTVVNLQGEQLDSKLYDFNSKIGIIVAKTKKLAQATVKLLA